MCVDQIHNNIAGSDKLCIFFPVSLHLCIHSILNDTQEFAMVFRQNEIQKDTTVVTVGKK